MRVEIIELPAFRWVLVFFSLINSGFNDIMFQRMKQEQINRYKVEDMKRFTMLLLAVLVPLSGLTDQRESVDEQNRHMEERFNGAYAGNDLNTYFGNSFLHFCCRIDFHYARAIYDGYTLALL
jgi:hypothetical protein